MRLCLAACAALARIVQFTDEIVLMFALGGRRLRIMGLFGLGPGLLDGGVHTLEVPLLIAPETKFQI